MRVSRACPMRSGNSAFPIAADCFLAALVPGEYDGVLMRTNHSCQPNVGMGGNALLVSMRHIAADEELTIDYALFLGDPGFAMDCRCGTAACRGVVRGTDSDDVHDLTKPPDHQRDRGDRDRTCDRARHAIAAAVGANCCRKAPT